MFFNRRRAGARLLGLFGVALAASAPVRTDDPVSSSVRFNREIIRIIHRRCEACHTSGGLVMSLSNYRDARAWGRAMREELVTERMPPGPVAPGYGRFQSDPSLTSREMTMLLTWLDGGMPRGDDADLPPPAAAVGDAAESDAADVRLELPPQAIPAAEDLIVRRIRIDAGRAAGRSVARVIFRPGDRRIVRGALVHASAPSASATSASSAPSTSWLGAWLPWQHAAIPPSTHAFSVPAQIIVDVYYRGGDEPIVDRSAIDLRFAQPDRGPIEDVVVEAAPLPARTADSTHRLRGERRLAQPATLWAIQPQLDPAISSVEVRAQRADGSMTVLMWMPEVRHDWPHALVLEQPMALAAGTTITVNATAKDLSGTARVTFSTLQK